MSLRPQAQPDVAAWQLQATASRQNIRHRASDYSLSKSNTLKVRTIRYMRWKSGDGTVVYQPIGGPHLRTIIASDCALALGRRSKCPSNMISSSAHLVLAQPNHSPGRVGSLFGVRSGYVGGCRYRHQAGHDHYHYREQGFYANIGASGNGAEL